MENQNKKNLLFMALSLVAGVLIGAGVMSVDPLHALVSTTAAPTSNNVRSISYSGVVNKVGANGFSMYSANGDIYEVTYNSKTAFAEIMANGTYSPTTAAAVKLNYYMSAKVTSNVAPFLATSVVFKAFDSAPYPYVMKPASTNTPTTPGSTTPGTTPAPTSTTTTPAGTNNTTTTSASTN